MSTATDMYAAYLAAETAILTGKAYTLGGRSLTREDLDKVRAGRKEWEKKVAIETATTNNAPMIGGLPLSAASFNRETHYPDDDFDINNGVF